MVDDFLHNLRSGKLKRSGKERRQYDNPMYKGPEKRSGRDRRGPGKVSMDRIVDLLNDTVPSIKAVLESINENQKNMASIKRARAQAEERKAEAMESIVNVLQEMLSSRPLFFEGKQVEPQSSLEPARAFNEIAEVKKPDSDQREEVLQLISELRNEGLSYDKIAQNLRSRGLSTFSGKGTWHGQTVQKLFRQITEES
jgi:hypothetical protein